MFLPVNCFLFVSPQLHLDLPLFEQVLEWMNGSENRALTTFVCVSVLDSRDAAAASFSVVGTNAWWTKWNKIGGRRFNAILSPRVRMRERFLFKTCLLRVCHYWCPRETLQKWLDSCATQLFVTSKHFLRGCNYTGCMWMRMLDTVMWGWPVVEL